MSLQLSLDEPLLNEVVHKAAGTSGSVYHGDFLWRALVSGPSEQRETPVRNSVRRRNSMITVTGTFFVRSGCEKDTLRILRDHVKQAHKDPDLLVSQVYRSRKEPRHFFVLERFADWDAYVAHRSTRDYGKYIVTNLYDMLELETFSVDVYDLVISSEV